MVRNFLRSGFLVGVMSVTGFSSSVFAAGSGEDSPQAPIALPMPVADSLVAAAPPYCKTKGVKPQYCKNDPESGVTISRCKENLNFGGFMAFEYSIDSFEPRDNVKYTCQQLRKMPVTTSKRP